MLGKLFGGNTETKPEGKFVPKAPSGPRTRRSSGGWQALRKMLADGEPRVILDLGPTSPTNINFLTGQGHSVFMADPLHDLATGDYRAEDGSIDAQRFLDNSLDPAARRFDVVLLWDTLDFLPEQLQQPLVDRIAAIMQPEGQLLALFHGAEPKETGHRRFHLTEEDALDAQAGAGYPHMSVLQNRQVEKLFHAFPSRRVVLARDNIRETVFTR